MKLKYCEHCKRLTRHEKWINQQGIVEKDWYCGICKRRVI